MDRTPPPDPGGQGFFCHETALVEPGAEVGRGTRVWAGVQIRKGARVGRDCVLGKDVFIDTGVVIGDRVKIQNGVSVYRGVTIESEVFVGPGVVFTNDRHPRATGAWRPLPTLVKRGASLGANSTILPGVVIGEGAMVGAGAVVTRDVPDGLTVVGNPARPLRRPGSARGSRPTGERDGPCPARRPRGGQDLRVGLVGLGNMGRKHARLLAALGLPSVEFACVYDVDPRRAEAVARTSAGVVAASSLDQLCDLCRAVVVAVPTSEHYAVARRVLEAGCHLLLEKPATADPQRLAELEAEAARRGLVLEVGFVERHNAAIRELLERVEPDREVVAVEARRLGGPPGPPGREGGGRSGDGRPDNIVWDLMIHDLDLLMALSGGGDVEAVGAVLGDGWAAAVLAMSGGVKACLEAAYISQDKVRTVRVFTPRVTYEVDCLTARLTVYSGGEASYKHGVYLQSVQEETVLAPHGEPLRLQAETFLRKCLGEREPAQPLDRFVPASDVLRLGARLVEGLSSSDPPRPLDRAGSEGSRCPMPSV
mgnify:FL=1